MIRYTAEQKTDALNKAAEIGVQKAHEETGISTQTLYKWQREAKANDRTVDPATLDAKKALADIRAYTEKIAMLEAENTALRGQNGKLMAQNERLRGVVTMLIG